MANRTGVALHHAVRDGVVACDEAVRNAGPTMIAEARVATGGGVRGMGLEAVCAETTSPARRGVEGMTAAAMETARGTNAASVKPATRMNATTAVETATHRTEAATAAMEATATHAVEATASTTVEATAPTTVEATAPTAMETSAPATMEAAAATATKTAASARARLGCVCKHQPCNCAREDRSKRQRNPFAVRCSQHIFLHLNERRLGRPAEPEATLATSQVVDKFRERD
jgi:hypothetical protein